MKHSYPNPSADASRKLAMTFRARAARGQSMIEFVVICAALVAALFVPVIDDVSGGRRLSTAQLLIDNLQQGYQRTSGALSLPE